MVGNSLIFICIAFRALASPAWISLTSSDPILSAFKLSRELQKRAKVEDEFKDQYQQLAGGLKQADGIREN